LRCTDGSQRPHGLLTHIGVIIPASYRQRSDGDRHGDFSVFTGSVLASAGLDLSCNATQGVCGVDP